MKCPRQPCSSLFEVCITNRAVFSHYEKETMTVKTLGKEYRSEDAAINALETEIAEKFGVSHSTVRNVKKRLGLTGK